MITSALLSSTSSSARYKNTHYDSYQKRKSSQQSLSPPTNSAALLARRNNKSKVAMGDLSYVSQDSMVESTSSDEDDGSSYGFINGFSVAKNLKMEYSSESTTSSSSSSSEHWNSFYKRFGNKNPKKKKQREFFSREKREEGIWSTFFQYMLACTNPREHCPVESDEWFEEVPLQRQCGYLDIRQVNGRWHFWEQEDSVTDVDYKLIE